MRLPKFGRPTARPRNLRNLEVDIPERQAAAQAAAAGGNDPSPYGQPLIMPASLRGTKRDFRSPRVPSGPSSAREPALRKRKAVGHRNYQPSQPAEPPVAGWAESAAAGPAPAPAAAAQPGQDAPDGQRNEQDAGAPGDAGAPKGAVAGGLAIAGTAIPSAPAAQAAGNAPEPPASARAAAAGGGGHSAWAHSVGAAPMRMGGRSSARHWNASKGFNEAAKLYHAQPPSTSARLPPMHAAGGGAAVPKPPPNRREVAASSPPKQVYKRAGGVRSTSPTQTDVRRHNQRVEPLSEGVHIWHAPTLPGQQHKELRTSSNERTRSNERKTSPGRRSPGRHLSPTSSGRASSRGREVSHFQSRFADAKATDMEIETASAKMAQLRVTPRGEQQPVAWGDRPTVVPKPPAGVSAMRPHVHLPRQAEAVTVTAPPPPPIFVLPAELLLIIFRQLNHVPELIRLSAVCKRLRQVALHRRLWNKVEFHDDARITPELLHSIAVRNPRMSKLSVQSCKNVNDRAIFAVASACHSLREIDVSDCPFVTFQTLNVILGSLGELRRLNASGCEKNVELAITRPHPNLQEILISDCEVDDSTALSIANGCPNLRKLDISGSTAISHQTLAGLSRCPQLHSLSFGDIAVGGHGAGGGGFGDAMGNGSDSGSDSDRTPLGSIKDEHIELFASGCPDLREVEITGCGALTGSAVTQLLCRCRKLTKLSMRSCDALADCTIPFGAGLDSFGLRALELQNCAYVSDLAVLNILSRCPLIKDLNLYGCFGLTDGCIGHDGGFGKLQLLNLGNCRIGAGGIGQIATAASSLRVLILGNEHETEATTQESSVTDDVLACLGQRNPKLEHLDIYSSSCTGAGLSLLSQGCRVLSAATFSNCPRMAQLQPVVQPMHALLSLTVKECPIVDQDTETIVAAAPRLTYLCIQNPSRLLSGDSVRAISQGLPALTSLCLSGCSGIVDDVSLSPMPHLDRFSLYDCHEITPVSCLAIVLAAPGLRCSLGGATVERCSHLQQLQAGLPLLLKRHLQPDPLGRGILVQTDAAAPTPAPAPGSEMQGDGDPFAGLSPLHSAGEFVDRSIERDERSCAAEAATAMLEALPFATQRIMLADDSPTTVRPPGL